MPFQPGRKKTGGRKSGVIGSRQSVRDFLDSHGFSPFTVLREVASGELMCGVCRGHGKTKYQPAKGEGKTFERTCESCYGSGKERVSPAERSRAAAELAKYVEPQLKAIEVTGPSGGPVQSRHEIAFVPPPLTSGDL